MTRQFSKIERLERHLISVQFESISKEDDWQQTTVPSANYLEEQIYKDIKSWRNAVVRYIDVSKLSSKQADKMIKRLKAKWKSGV